MDVKIPEWYNPNLMLRVFAFALFILFLATCFRMFAEVSWLTELFTHFELQYTIGGLGLAVIFWLMKHKNLAGFSLLLFFYHSFFLIPFFLNPDVSGNTKTEFSLVQFNVYKFNERNDDIINWLKTGNFDIVNLQEVREGLAGRLKDLKKEYPYQLVLPRDDSFGTALLSKKTFIVAKNIELEGADNYNHYIVAQIDLGQGKALDLYAIHAMSPIAASAAEERDRQLLAVADVAGKDKHGIKLFMGDFNLTPYSPYFHKVLDASGLRNSMVGYGVQNTWTSDLPFAFLRLPIDHVLVSDEISILDRRVYDDSLGSDHFPVILRLAVR